MSEVIGAYLKYIDEHEEDIVGFLRVLLGFESVKSAPEPGKPFGEQVDACYRAYLAQATSDDFDIFDAEGYGGHVEFQGLITDDTGDVIATADETLGAAVHLDVVPVASGWTHDPFAGDIDLNGNIFGRGTLDNKGSAAAVYFALKALKETGFVPSKNVRIILGLDEETGWSGMVKYLEQVDHAPDFGFTPDAEFPAIHAEKGILSLEFAKKLGKTSEKGISLRSIEGGNAANSVPDFARAIIVNDLPEGYSRVKEKIAEFRERTGYTVRGKGVGKAYEIVAEGRAAHAATPEKGLNAISVLMAFLGEIDIVNDSIREFVGFYNSFIGFELHGESLGICFSDEVSGDLTFNAGVISMDTEAVILTVNIRYPVTMVEADVYDVLVGLADARGLGIIRAEGSFAPVYVPADDPLVATLVDIYKEHTGDVDAKPIAIGGGTYSRAFKKVVAFGPLFPGQEDLMHQKDEYISINNLIKITKIYADAIYKLSK
jgi:succinyl-diaminopimelate desuccinylase